jgi:hypothetical protein
MTSSGRRDLVLAVLRIIGNLGEDRRPPLRQRLADGAFVAIRMCEVWEGGVAGVSPAEGGAPAIVAPARGKAFPPCPDPLSHQLNRPLENSV